MRAWTIRDSIELYQVPQWGRGFFGIDEKGELRVQPHGTDGPGVSLPSLVEDLRQRGLRTPLLLQFPRQLQWPAHPVLSLHLHCQPLSLLMLMHPLLLYDLNRSFLQSISNKARCHLLQPRCLLNPLRSLRWLRCCSP